MDLTDTEDSINPERTPTPELRPQDGKAQDSGREHQSDSPTIVSPKTNTQNSTIIENQVPFGEELVGTAIGNYLLEEFLGSGGMGAVFRASCDDRKEPVAVKVLRPDFSDPESIRRFRSEANNLAILDHHNIASVYQVGKDKGWNFIVLEYVPGLTLFHYVLERGPLDLGTFFTLFSQLADALDHAHDRGIIHRDIKPSNILFSDSGEVKLVDMGLALVQNDRRKEEEICEKDLTIGSVDYLSPEQARDPGSVDPKSDLYSLGCTMFFSLTGKAPFYDRPTLKKLLNHSAPQRPSVRSLKPSVPEALDKLIQRLMAVDQSDRPISAKACQEEMSRISHSVDRQNRVGTWWPILVRWSCIGLLSLVITAVVYLFLRFIT